MKMRLYFDEAETIFFLMKLRLFFDEMHLIQRRAKSSLSFIL
jgi:hypothetical protein